MSNKNHSIIISSYGNSPAGEHLAIFKSYKKVRYPHGRTRLLLSFLILEKENQPLVDENYEEYTASIICNPSDGSNPKSKVYKVIKAMLKKDEYDPIFSSIEIPKLNHFLPKKKSLRYIRVKVETKNEIGIITKIKRPRDGKWVSIEGKFEGKKETNNALNNEILKTNNFEDAQRSLNDDFDEFENNSESEDKDKDGRYEYIEIGPVKDSFNCDLHKLPTYLQKQAKEYFESCLEPIFIFGKFLIVRNRKNLSSIYDSKTIKKYDVLIKFAKTRDINVIKKAIEKQF